MTEWLGDVGQAFAEIAGSGSLMLAVPVALLAGLVSFFSPCCLPLLPGYLSYATGLSASDVSASGAGLGHRGRMLAGSLLFVLGFTVVFVSLGAAFGALGGFSAALWDNRRVITVVLGLLVILMGVAFMGWVPFLNRDLRVHKVPAVGLAAAPFLGFLFGLGWAPCLGPTLGAIQTLAWNEGTAGRGILLSVVYSLGLGIPFVVAALASTWAFRVFGVLKRHQLALSRAGGGMLVLVGVLLVTGWWDWAVQWLQGQLVSDTETLI